MSKEIFSKVIPNVRVDTVLNDEGDEINAEVREDVEATQSRKKIFDLLLSAGYYRVMIKNLSDFDKIVGGMTWCIEACEFDVDADILFHENLTIGQKMKKNAPEPADIRSQVRLTLLEYGVKSLTPSSESSAINTQNENINNQQDEVLVEELMNKNLAIVEEEEYQSENLSPEEREQREKHYENLKSEITIDALKGSKELSEKAKLRNLEMIEQNLTKRLNRIKLKNETLLKDNSKDLETLESYKKKNEELLEKIKQFDEQQDNEGSMKSTIEKLILENEKMKTEEIQLKENCTKIIEDLHKQIEEAERISATSESENLAKYNEIFENEKKTLNLCRLELAKKNRSVNSLQRRIDNIPDNIELAQYQRRLLELNNNMSLKTKETKQYYDLYNTLSTTLDYLEKELTYLNSIYDNYNSAMATPASRDQFLKKFEEIVDGIAATKMKFKHKYDEEKLTRDNLNSDLLVLLDLQRKYAAVVKQFKVACEKV
ncbi:CLUMA_CG013364, isoform A [Clunio marinus]|uniref:Coiled-coil domain-containing protein 93 n=1 Tax=Clunio marinus TaxID=568069 RepID=A0A1J1IK01_9DIPT|nr:CLUMA_CG013364, isoform A [Clunio marinus]